MLLYFSIEELGRGPDLDSECVLVTLKSDYDESKFHLNTSDFIHWLPDVTSTLDKPLTSTYLNYIQ